jgi:outer membrane protein assembly factor BamE (lipoprotein component of BamABCDE complex)
VPEVAVRTRFLILTGVVLAGALVVSAAVRPPNWYQRLVRSRLMDKEHCERIKEGMRREEVEALLGGPPGTFTSGEVQYWEFHDGSLGGDGPRWEHWSGQRGQIAVRFDEGGAVRDCAFDEVFDPCPPPSLADRVCAWLRRLWP